MKFRGLLGLLVVVVIGYVGWQVAPPYMNAYQFEDGIKAIARFSSVDPRVSEEEIRRKVYAQAQENHVPVELEQINVSRIDTEVSIWTEYTVHIDLPIHPIDLKFAPSTKNKPITM